MSIRPTYATGVRPGSYVLEKGSLIFSHRFLSPVLDDQPSFLDDQEPGVPVLLLVEEPEDLPELSVVWEFQFCALDVSQH